MSKLELRDKVIIKRRMLIIFCILLLLFFLLVGRLVYIMIFKSSMYKAEAEEQWTSEVKIDARRGRILDRNGTELAVSANVYRVDLDMNTLRSTISKTPGLSMNIIAQKLASPLEMKEDEVLKILNKTLPNGKPMGSAILKRRIEKEAADKVSALNINGVMVSPDTKRYYPKDNFLSQTIGHLNTDGKGQNGIELTYDSVLSGKPGVRTSEIDKHSPSDIPYTISTFTKPQDGKDVRLTIDAAIQSFCEKAANQALIDNKAKAVSILVSDPNTGEILAMVNKPDYNPNTPIETGKSFNEVQQMWRNRSVSDTFEPGSVFKIVTATAAMTEGVVKENDTFNCNGSLTVGKSIIHCWKRTGHGQENFIDILKNSCNVGFMTLGQRLGKENLNKYINLFGFGQKTGIDLNGEATGIVKKTANISDTDLATLSFGQVDTVSLVQYITAFNAIANGGKWIRPHLMKDIEHPNGAQTVIDKQYDNYGTKQILNSEITKQLRGYLEKVISEGGGKKAYIDGYNIAGKTGTAQKPINGVYVPGKYIASFGGMAPADNPKVTVVISIDEPDPSNYYAGQIVTPVAKQVFSDIFNYWNIAPSGSTSQDALKDVLVPEVRGMKKNDAIKILKNLNLAYDVDSNGDYIVNMTPIPGATVKEGSKVILYTGTSPTYNKVVVVPDVTGLGKEKALEVLNSLGLQGTFDGDGIVESQDVNPGEQVNKGTSISMELDDELD